MLKSFKRLVLWSKFRYYGKLSDRYHARMKACETGGDEFVYWFEKSYTMMDKQIEALNELYAMRVDV